MKSRRHLSAHASRMREKSPIFVKPKLSITPIIAISSLVLTSIDLNYRHRRTRSVRKQGCSSCSTRACSQGPAADTLERIAKRIVVSSCPTDSIKVQSLSLSLSLSLSRTHTCTHMHTHTQAMRSAERHSASKCSSAAIVL